MPYIKQEDLKTKLEKLHREGEERAAERLAQKLGYEYKDLAKTPIALDAVRIIPEGEARSAMAAVIQVASKKAALAVLNPEFAATKKIIEDLKAKNYELKIFVVSTSGLNVAFDFYKFVKPESEVITGKVMITKARLEELRGRLTNLASVKHEF